MLSAPSASMTTRSTPSATPEQSGRQQVVIDGLLRKAARGAFAVILLKPQALFMGVGQLVETVRQLNTFVIDLKALSDPMIFRADLR
jgi:hypothetical protein